MPEKILWILYLLFITNTFFSFINTLKHNGTFTCHFEHTCVFAFCFADVYNLLLCNVYSGGPQGRWDLSNFVASENKVVVIIII